MPLVDPKRVKLRSIAHQSGSDGQLRKQQTPTEMNFGIFKSSFVKKAMQS